MINIVLFGAGGHCLSCIDVISYNKKFKIKGIIDKKFKKISGYDVIFENDLKKILKITKNAHISFGFIKNVKKRANLFEHLKKRGFQFPIIRSPKAYIAKKVKIGEGTILMHHVLVNYGSAIGKNCIINSKSLIEHGVTIKDNCHISTGVIINGDCIINQKTFIGSGTVVNQGVEVGENCIIGSNLTIKKNVKANSLIV
jgi:sugar O-acyltransferase (sialic acid O-acetyltransferase NeuD family)